MHFFLTLLALAILCGFGRPLLKLAGAILAILAVLILIFWVSRHPWPGADAAERASDPQILTAPTLEQCTYQGGPQDPLPHLWVFQGCPAGSDYGPPLQPGTPAQPEDLGYGSGRSDQLVPVLPSRERASDPLADRKALDTLLRNEHLTPLN